MDHRTTSQEASTNGHQKPESAVAKSLREAVRLFQNYGLVANQLPNDAFAAGRWINSARAALISKSPAPDPAKEEELLAAYERIAKLEADLHECLEYIEQEVDVVDGDYGQPAPNRAMQLVSMIDETLNGRVQ